jgi:hypothetical protein
MNPIDAPSNEILHDVVKPVPVWLKFGVPVLLLLIVAGGGVVAATRSNAPAAPVNIDPPGGIATNAVLPGTNASVPVQVASLAQTPAQANTPAGAIGVPATMANAVAPAAMPGRDGDMLKQLDKLSGEVSKLQLLVTQLSDVSGQLNQRIAQLDERLPKVLAKPLATPAALRKPVAKPATVVTLLPANATPADMPTVIAVDSWDGRPSVSIKTASGVAFAGEGELVNGWQVVSTNPRTQSVEFYRPAQGRFAVAAQPPYANVR